jgi:hypothetical protein
MATPLDITALETSFDLVAARREELVDRFYRRLFRDAPPTRGLFTRADMPAQKRALLGALVALRRSLRDLSSIAPFLADLGARHARYGVSAEHYPLVAGQLAGDPIARAFVPGRGSAPRAAAASPRRRTAAWAGRGRRCGLAAVLHQRVGAGLPDGRPDHDRRRRAVRSRCVTTRTGP